ncbi:hypothetical protein [Rhodohalobacter sp. 614A]|uniref:hypothetical protein n=1 Tax=Rhodohalobacter sp. 614A TaxID=2908649 RepID=UPI001F34A6B1|nr:hypothetical protein [Rhodohalobacter sp. 614A]
MNEVTQSHSKNRDNASYQSIMSRDRILPRRHGLRLGIATVVNTPSQWTGQWSLRTE